MKLREKNCNSKKCFQFEQIKLQICKTKQKWLKNRQLWEIESIHLSSLHPTSINSSVHPMDGWIIHPSFIYLSIYLSIHPPTYLPIYSSLNPSSIYASINHHHLSIHLYIIHLSMLCYFESSTAMAFMHFKVSKVSTRFTIRHIKKRVANTVNFDVG